uniref:Uncharacterized protein n=1 Tax=viral metagenome TaxID=1070528 RepID=A0A6C0AQP8_9ZZZZ
MATILNVLEYHDTVLRLIQIRYGDGHKKKRQIVAIDTILKDLRARLELLMDVEPATATYPSNFMVIKPFPRVLMDDEQVYVDGYIDSVRDMIIELRVVTDATVIQYLWRLEQAVTRFAMI